MSNLEPSLISGPEDTTSPGPLGAVAVTGTSRPAVVGRSRLLIAILAVVALSSLRLIHLEADTPTNLALESLGAYVDEGYKTLDARNLSLYGSTRWNPHDDFAGWWLDHSALPSAAYYLAFRLFGDSLGSARLVTVLWFALFLLGYVYATWRDYPAPVFYLGLFLLSLAHLVFFFSRIALTVQPLITCLCWALFLLRSRVRRPLSVGLLICGFLLIGTFLIKETAVLHFLPIPIGVAAAWAAGTRPAGRQLLASGGALAIACCLTAMLTRDLWLPFIHEIALPIEFRLALFHPLTESSALPIAAGLLCCAHWLASQRNEFWGSVYCSSLSTLVVLGPPALWVLPFSPTRYYVPLLPVFVLIVLEWLYLRSWESWPRKRTGFLLSTACIGLFVWAMLCIGRAASKYALSGFESWEGLGESGRILFPYAEIAAALAVIAVWRLRQQLLGGRAILAVVATVLVLGVARDVRLVGRFVVQPTYNLRETAAEIDRLIPEGASLGGDWAPIFALGSNIKALRMGSGFNNPAIVPLRMLRPDYYLFSDTAEGRSDLQSVESEEGLALESPVLDKTHLGRSLVLYPLRYTAE